MPNDLPGRFDLAHAEPFRLGEMLVEPSLRQVSCGARCQRIEPKVMQVLVVLATAAGRTLSRDDLIHLCWNDRIVGDNAIHRVLSHARKIARTVGGGTFDIETIKGVGYRLVSPGGQTFGRPALWALAGAPVNRRTLTALIGVAGAAGVLAFQPWSRRSQANAVAQGLFERGEVARREEEGNVSGEQAIALYRAAIRESPDFAPAWGGLALAYCLMIDASPDDDSDRYGQLCIAAVQKALQLDPVETRARIARVLVKPKFGRWDQRRTELQLIDDVPMPWEISTELGRLSAHTGRVGAATEMLRAALTTQPLLPRVQGDLFYALWSAGDFHEAESVLDNGIQRWPRNWYLWNARFQYLAMARDAAAARGHVRNEDHWPQGLSPVAISKRLRAIDVLVGQGENDRQSLAEAYVGEAREHLWAIRNASVMLVALGAHDVTLEILEGFYFGEGRFARSRRIYSRRPTDFIYLPPFDGMRANPRFRALMTRIGLPFAVQA